MPRPCLTPLETHRNLLALLALCSACDAAPPSLDPTDAGPDRPDTRMPMDAGDLPDASSPDISAPDGSPPDAGAPDASPPDVSAPLPCDDGNPCTRDWAEAGGCVFEPRPDETPCEDGLLCTLGDRCRAGTCEPGARQVSTLEKTSEARSFGGLYGAVLGLGSGNFVFLDRAGRESQLVSARIRQNVELRARSSISTTFHDAPQLVSATDEGRFAIVDESFGGDRVLIVYTLASDGRVMEHARAPVPSPGYAPASMVIADDEAYVCANFFFGGSVLHRFEIGRALRHVETLALSSSACSQIAFDAGSKRLFLNTSDGVRTLRLGGSPVEQGVFHGRARPRIANGLLALHDASGIELLDPTDLSLLGRIQGRFAAFHVGEDAIWVEGIRPAAGTSEGYVAAYRATAPYDPIAELVLHTFASAVSNDEALASAGGPRHYIHSYTKRILRLDGGDIAEVRDARIGDLSRLQARGSEVAVRSRFTAHRLAGGASLDFVAGGSHEAATLGHSLELSEHPALWSTRNPSTYARDPDLVEIRSHDVPQLSLRRYDADERAHTVGNISLPSEPAYLLVAGDHLYRLRAVPGAFAAELQRFAFRRDMQPELIQTLRLSDDVQLEGAALQLGLHVDPTGRTAVVTAGLYGTDGQQVGRLFFVDLSDSSVEMVELGEMPGRARIHERRVVASATSVTYFWSADDGLRSLPIATLGPLAFDGETAYLGDYNGMSTIAWTATSSASATHLELPGPARSIDGFDGGLLVGAGPALQVLTPACPAW